MKLESKRILRIKRNLYQLGILSFAVVLIWIGFEIYWSYNKQPDINVNQNNLQPLSNNLYLDLAETLSQRQTIPLIQLEAFKQAIKSNSQLSREPESTPNSSFFEASSSPLINPEATSSTNLQ